MSRRRHRRRPQVYSYNYKCCRLTVTVRSGRVHYDLEGSLTRVCGADRERVAAVLDDWTRRGHEACYAECWAGIPLVEPASLATVGATP